MSNWRRYLGKSNVGGKKKQTNHSYSRRSTQQLNDWLQSKSTSNLRQALRQLERKSHQQREKRLVKEDMLMERVDEMVARQQEREVVDNHDDDGSEDDDEKEVENVLEADKRELQRALHQSLEDRFDDDDDDENGVDEDNQDGQADDQFDELLMS